LATRSAEKAHRQSLKRRIRNRAAKSATKTAVKNAGTAIVAGDMDAARASVRTAIAELDRAAQKGIIHPNNAARRKSRLLLRYNAAVAAIQSPAEEKPARKTAARSTATRGAGAKGAPKASRARKTPAKKATKK
jgi:small subunit ribosomal protein S20